MKRKISVLISLILLITTVLGTTLAVTADASLPPRYIGNNDPQWIKDQAKRLVLKYENMSYTKSDDVKIYTSDDGDTKGFAVPRKENEVYYNPLTVTFNNTGAILGEQTKTVFEITKVSLGTNYGSGKDRFSSSKPVVFAAVRQSNGAFWAGATCADHADPLNFTGHVYGGNVKVTYRMTVYSMETGRIINFPFAVVFKDIDQMNDLDGTHEAVESVKLSAGDFSEYWRWNAFNLDVDGYTYKPRKDVSINGDESYTKAGFVAMSNTRQNSITVTHQCGGNMATRIEPYKVVNMGQFRIQKKTPYAGKLPSSYSDFSGCTYSLKDSNGAFIGNIVLNKNGVNTSQIQVPAGTYYLEEVSGNQWYECNTTDNVKVVVNRNDTEAGHVVYVTDEPKTGEINITKKVISSAGFDVPEDQEYLRNLKFLLSSQDKGDVYEVSPGTSYSLLKGTSTRLTDSTWIRITDVPYGTYSIIEDSLSLADAEAANTGKAGGFSENSIKTLSIIVGQDGTTIVNQEGDITDEYVNDWEEKTMLRLKVQKEIIGDGPLSDWKFGLYKDRGCKEKVDEGTTNGDGLAVIDNIPSTGTYFLKEETKLKTHTAAENPIEVVVGRSKNNTIDITGLGPVSENNATFINNENYVTIKAIKSEILANGDAGSNIKNIAFKLYKDGSLVATEKTNNNGICTFDGSTYHLKPGNYVLEEQGFDDTKYVVKSQVEGYKAQSIAFSIEGDEGTKSVYFTNEEVPLRNEFSLSLKKTSSDEQSQELENYTYEGIQYGVYLDSGCAQQAGIITLNEAGTGRLSFRTEESMDTCEVWIQEIDDAGSNYVLDNQTYHYTAAQGELLEIELEDDPETGSLTFSKEIICEKGEAPGPEQLTFTLTNRDSAAVTYSAHPAANGTVTFRNVLLGEYILTESGNADYEGGLMIPVSDSRTVNIKAGPNTTETWTNEWVVDNETGGLMIQKTSNNGYIANDKSMFHVTLTNQTTGSVYDGNFSKSGTLLFEDLEPGEYTIHEDLTQEQKKLYKQPADQTVTIIKGETETQTKRIYNELKTTTITVIKKSSDGWTSDIEFTMHGTAADGQRVNGKKAYSEDAEINGEPVGICVFENVKAGDYVIEETSFNAANYTSNHRVEGYDNPAQAVSSDGITAKTLTFINTPFEFHLTKTELLEDGTPTGEPVSGAVYTMYKVDPNDMPTSEEQLYSAETLDFTTDADGKIDVSGTGIKRGTWLLYETETPEGYIEDTTVSAAYPIPGVTKSEIGRFIDTVTFDDDHPVQLREDQNQRQYGSVSFTKADEGGLPVKGAEFTLYTDQGCSEVAINKDGAEMIATTDDVGSIKVLKDGVFQTAFSGLPWGTYYLKETVTPGGYTRNDKVYVCDVSGNNVNCVVSDSGGNIVNTRGKGKVRLQKINGSTKKPIQKVNEADRAMFDVYTDDGQLVYENLLTEQDGTLLVEDLSWGKYYFKEVRAPKGFALSEEPVRFTVNILNTVGGGIQEVNAPNYPAKAAIVCTVKIKAKDYWKDHGDPTFFAKLDGDATYIRPITFDEEYVTAHTDIDGYVSKSVCFNVDAGQYTLRTEKADRFELDEGYPGGAVNTIILGERNEDTAVFPMINEGETGAATFVYKKTDWSEYGDQTVKTNIIKKEKTFTGVSVSFLGDEQNTGANMPFSKDLLSVYAVLDDGSSIKLGPDEEYDYSVTLGNEPLERFPSASGYYTYTVTATIKGTTRQGTFTVFVSPWKKIKLLFHTKGGSMSLPQTTCPIDKEENVPYIEIYQYTAIGASVDVSQLAIQPAVGKMLDTSEGTGWYKDEACTEPLDMTAEITKNTHFYPKWKTSEYTVAYHEAKPDETVSISGMPDQQIKLYNQALTLSNATPSIDKGYEFIGWSLNQHGSSTSDVNYAPGDTYSSNQRLDLYAVWQPHTAQLSYNASGGSLNGVPQSETMKYNTAAYVYSDAVPIKTGSNFVVWNTKVDETGTEYDPGDQYKAIYEEPVTGTLYAIYDSEDIPVAQVPKITTAGQATLKATDNVGVTAYYFGTNSNPSAGDFTSVSSTASFNLTVPVSQTGTYYFRVRDNDGNLSRVKKVDVFEFRYVCLVDGGSAAGYNVHAKLKAAGNTVGTGKSFTGLYAKGTAYELSEITSEEANVEYINVADGSAGTSGVIGKNTTVTLEFGSRATLTYDANMTDGYSVLTVDGMPENAALKYERETKAGSAPTRTGFAFAGWNTKANGSGTGYAAGDVVKAKNAAAQNTTLYAQWTKLNLGATALSWSDVKTIGDLGIADSFFAADFTAVKNDIADDGQLSVTNLNQHTKTTEMSGNTVHMLIAGFDHDDTESGGKAAITFISYEIVGMDYMDDPESDITTWGESQMRNYTLKTVLNGMPSDVKSVIKPVVKKSGNVTGTAITETIDQLFLPSTEELYGENAG